MKKSHIYFKLLLIMMLFLIGLPVLAVDSSDHGFLNENNGSYQDSADAIAIRIIPNIEHYSISKWYKNQGFSGSPQSLVVDGYEAIRDGRTVYVNATNIKNDPSNPNSRIIYTNIYLISYNQDPSVKTVDILGQIIKNWKFNSELKESVNPAPSCSVSTTICTQNSDCGSGQFCAAEPPKLANTCQLKTKVNCLFDSDCPSGFFCDSYKAKLIRDVKRIGQAVEISQALQKYQSSQGKYPELSAGSYLSGRSISVWPSWNNIFLKELSLSNKFVDPVNRLGYCDGFDKKTCWNESARRFYQFNESSVNASLSLPPGSLAYAYQSVNGKTFNFCQAMEMSIDENGMKYQFASPVQGLVNCSVVDFFNTTPYFVSSRLEGEAGKEFIGWVEFADNQKDRLTWSMRLVGDNWATGNPSNKKSSWPSLPTLQDTGNPYQKKIYSQEAGSPGSYKVEFVVSDGKETATKEAIINIVNTKPFIEAENISYKLNPLQPFVYKFYFSDDNLNDYQKAFSITKTGVAGSSFDLLNSSLAVNSRKIEESGNNRYAVSYSYKIPTSTKFAESSSNDYIIKVTDRYNDFSNKNIKISLINEAPLLDFKCVNYARIGGSYSCVLGPKKQVSAGNQVLKYSFIPSFANLKLDLDSDANYVLLKSNNVQDFDSSHSSRIEVSAVNEYGAVSKKNFDLKINTFCGDGVKQGDSPNDEGRGGIYNDGYEDCDGLEGVSSGADRVSKSRVDNQYACATFDSNTPYPIPNNSYCVYKSPVSGGGFCGDRYCQVKDDKGNLLENYDNCPGDCLHLCQPNCSGKQCGSDGCGGTCGACGVLGEECYNGRCCASEGTLSLKLLNQGWVGTNNSPSVVFNNKIYELKNNSNTGTYFTKVPILHGKNVLALEGGATGPQSGFSVSLDHCSSKPIEPNNLNNAKCVNTIDDSNQLEVVCPGGKCQISNWTSINYNDYAWPRANIGFFSGVAAIWANDYDENHELLGKAYCRYSFDSEKDVPKQCLVPLDNNKNCGENNCGTYFRGNDCKVLGNNFNCIANSCTCPIETCASKNTAAGTSAGKLGSYCGPKVDSYCGSIDCSNNNCDPGLFCNLAYSSETDKSFARSYLNYKSPSDLEFLERSCGLDKPVNTCQKKCWYTSFTKSILVRQGDVPDQTACSVKLVEDPLCSSYTNPTCPSQCSIKNLVSGSLTKYSCYVTKYFLGIPYKDWTPRQMWSCSNTTATKNWYYDDVCFQDTGEKVRVDGTCGLCQPQCLNKACGSADGCGGTCLSGICGENQKCISGSCRDCGGCEDVFCGETDDCGNVCSETGKCPAPQTCSKGICSGDVIWDEL